MKTKITTGEYEMPAATIYEDSKLPDIYCSGRELEITAAAGEGLNGSDAENLGKGFIRTTLPYTLLNDYDRIKKPRKFISVTLENDYLKAVVLPEVGGRVWSLYDKKRGKELVFKNPVFQPCNFGLRGAWAAGGIEYNIGIRGHSVHTSDTVFCDINRYKDGRETVIIYEYERIRDVVWSVELYLPDNADSLFARVTIENTSDKEKYMYWWTNIAVAEEAGQRTLTPCERAFVTDYDGEGAHVLNLRSITDENGMNALYSDKNGRSRDYFYRIPCEREKWIVSADKDGYGLAYTSTDFLKGRKLFVWGMNDGGRNWCEFLSDKGLCYAEIQGGLSYHQFEHIPMPPHTAWQWIEAYTPFQGNGLIHSSDVSAAQSEAEKSLKMNGAKIEESGAFQGLTPENKERREIVTFGSGWGCIENLTRDVNGLKRISGTLPFSFICERPEDDWMHFVVNKRFKSESVKKPPRSFMAGGYITGLLEKAVAEGKAGAYTYLQLGTALFAAGNESEAVAAWEKSMKKKPNAWAARNIAMLKKHYRDYEAAYLYMNKAVSLNSEYKPLVIDCAKLYIEAKKYNEWIEVYKKLSPNLKDAGRIKFLTAAAYAGIGMLSEAEKLFNEDLVIEDLQECELSFENLWVQLYGENRPLPKTIDFRMNIKKVV